MHLNDLFSFKIAFLLSQFQIQGDDLTKKFELFFPSSSSFITPCGKTRNSLSLTENIFRQINSSVISLVKPLVSRNICHTFKSVSEKFRNFNTVASCITFINQYSISNRSIRDILRRFHEF